MPDVTPATLWTVFGPLLALLVVFAARWLRDKIIADLVADRTLMVARMDDMEKAAKAAHESLMLEIVEIRSQTTKTNGAVSELQLKTARLEGFLLGKQPKGDK